MKLASLALALFSAASASAKNPFEAKMSKNSAKARYVSKLVRGARETKNSQLRRLDENAEAEVDLTPYYFKFEKCQFVKHYDDEMAENEEYGTVLATKRYVVFRLCPSASQCSYGFGEYLVDLDDYLQATVQYQQWLQEDMCDACEECGQEEEAEEEEEAEGEEEAEEEDGGRKRRRRKLAVDCDSCADECEKIENMEENGYIDATEFIQCQMVYDPEDDGKEGYYAGPMCASSGTKIKIGLFSDENCYDLISGKDVEDYLVDGDGYQMKLSHALLKTVYADTSYSCLYEEEEDENADEDAEEEEEEEKEAWEMCTDLYEAAAKCEKPNGFSGGVQNYENYENQVAQEEMVCEYMKSLEYGTYDESGEIVVHGGSAKASGGSKTTGGQKFALTFFIIGTVALAAYAGVLHSKLTKGGKADLSRQGGAMA